jgi:hypothetical protein
MSFENLMENLPILFLNDFKMDFLKILSDQGRATSISLKPSVYRRFGGLVVRVMKNQNLQCLLLCTITRMINEKALTASLR